MRLPFVLETFARTLALGSLVACGSVQSAPENEVGVADAADASVDAGTVDDAGGTTDAAATDAPSTDAAPVDAGLAALCGPRGAPPCRAGSFCFRDGHCGEADQPGVCLAPPSGCTREYAPVCGCDGRTYGNVCEAQRASVSVRAAGPCAGRDAGGGEGAACGGFAGLACADGLFCLEPTGQCLTVADGMGVCAARPGSCPSVYAPVCGCDRVTYPNDCVARAAGKSVARTGTCT
jgi:hypothetical protein